MTDGMFGAGTLNATPGTQAGLTREAQSTPAITVMASLPSTLSITR